ncbi:glycosyltransferase family 39 protein [Actinoplanes sp. NPDC023936]|uniref:glycosyltransferase family 39 protein n=1 Tax=Actinoplanes sp. NPDC023936 TaxID=3154910 RepID=UPI0033CD6065
MNIEKPSLVRLRFAAAPAVLTLAVCLVGIGQRQFWRDEQATWWASALPLGDLRRLVEQVDVVLLPYYLFMHVWIALFGNSEIAMRVPSAILMGLAAGLLALVGRRLLDVPTGLLAGLLFALLPAVSRYGGEARPYAMALAATLAATLLLLRAQDRPSPQRWAFYGLSVIWIGLGHLVSLSVLAAHLALVITRARADRRVRIGWAVSVAAALVVLAPVILISRRQSGQIGWIDEPTWEVLRAFPGEVFVSGPVAALVLIPGLIGIGLLFPSNRTAATALLLWTLLPPVLAYLSFDALGLFYHRYFLFTVPAWLLAAAWALRRIFTTRRALVAAGVCAALVLVAAGLPNHRFVRSNAVEDELAWRDAARWLNGRLQPGDRVAYTGYARLHRGFSYEFSRLPGADPGEVYSQVTRDGTWWWDHELAADPAAGLDGVDRFWLVEANPVRGPLSRLPAEARRYVGKRYTIAETDAFTRLQVTLLTVKAGDGVSPG